VKADPEAQRRLLDVQAIDTTLAQLAHRRRSLPEHAEIERLTRDLKNLDDQRVTAQAAVDDLDRDIARVDRDVEQVRVRKDRDQARLDAGSGPPRELEALIHEIGSLNRRQSELEDSELELMEQREQAQARLSDAQRRLGEASQAREASERRRDEMLNAIAKEEEFRISGRRPLVADLPQDLIALYERAREQTSGFGAAALRGNRCEGCRLELSGSELETLRTAAKDEVIRHEECRRILVRGE
jgi:predicted  nucleic acid-binding Zn-ribbon protein